MSLPNIMRSLYLVLAAHYDTFVTMDCNEIRWSSVKWLIPLTAYLHWSRYNHYRGTTLVSKSGNL